MHRICLAALVLTSATSVACAQLATPAPEVRADLIAGRSVAEELAGGASVTSGDYLALVGDIGMGAITGARRGARLGARVDVLARLHLDASTERQWAPYLIGGASYLIDARDRGRPVLVAGLGIHAPSGGRFVPALEVGLGGGLRLGVVLRRAGRRLPT
jgi:hypothetical protein